MTCALALHSEPPRLPPSSPHWLPPSCFSLMLCCHHLKILSFHTNDLHFIMHGAWQIVASVLLLQRGLQTRAAPPSCCPRAISKSPTCHLPGLLSFACRTKHPFSQCGDSSARLYTPAGGRGEGKTDTLGNMPRAIQSEFLWVGRQHCGKSFPGDSNE